MSRSIFLLFISLALIKISASSELALQTELGLDSRPGIILDATKEIIALKANITLIWLQELAEINELKDDARSAERVASDSIKEQLRNLTAEVKNATKAAIDAGTNITSCVKEEAKEKSSTVQLWKLLRCGNSSPFNILKLKLTELATLKLESCNIIPTCILLHPLSNNKLNECIQNGINNTVNAVNSLQQKIDREAGEAYDRANDCIQDNLGNLDLAIETVSDNFNKCVEGRINATIISQ
ncbi:hypothetical protein HHI36_010043 [Cryptolaemus montrouzieri]|uniref:Venom protein n=1 Tax=Cryptolaemus montrouzieri TaxID=559131 RepID=A0ABD2MHP4_9CUCU